MNFSRSLVAIASIFALSLAVPGCVYSPSQDEEASKQMQAAGVGSEDVDADIDAEKLDAEEYAEISKEREDDSDSFSRTIPPLSRERHIKPIGGRDRQPISIGDISIIVEGSLDTTAVISESYWEQFTAWASGMPSMVFGWTVTGLPSGLSYSVGGSYNQNATIEGNPTVAGSYPILLRAAQAADSSNFKEYSYTLVVSGPGRDDDDDDDGDDDPCSEPLKVKLVEMGDWYICPDNYTGQVNCIDPEEPYIPAVTVGAERSMKFQVIGGKPPYTWHWASEVKDSRHCHDISGMMRFVSDEDECKPWEYDVEKTGNPTWKSDGVNIDPNLWDGKGIAVTTAANGMMTLTGEFLYNGPMKVIGDHMDENPLEVLTLKVTDACPGDSIASLSLTFEIEYPNDNGKNMHIDVGYGRLNTYGSGPDMHVRLYVTDPVDGEKMIGSGEISLADKLDCLGYESPCEVHGVIHIENDNLGVRDITDVKVELGLGWENCSQPFNPFKGCWSSSCDCSEYGDMDIQHIKLETDYWKLWYNDEEEGDNQIKQNNHASEYNITNKPGVEFKRQPFPEPFEDMDTMHSGGL